MVFRKYLLETPFKGDNVKSRLKRQIVRTRCFDFLRKYIEFKDLFWSSFDSVTKRFWLAIMARNAHFVR